MSTIKKSSAAAILFAWLVISIPLAWGIYNTGKNAMKLFHSSEPAAHP